MSDHTFSNLIVYLIVHGLSTVGAIIVFLLRNENRITRLEIQLTLLQKSHDTMTSLRHFSETHPEIP